MHSHGPSVLRGPVSRKRSWWSDWSPSRSTPETCTMSERSEKPSYEPEFRKELVKRIRREIAAGTYDTPEKWEAALERLRERL
jgi:negative regulator of flagellin synthesis FlgM